MFLISKDSLLAEDAPTGPNASKKPARRKRKNSGANGGESRGAKSQNNSKSGVTVLPIAGPARIKRRHYGVLLSFLLLVALPSFTVSWYMDVRAVDQFASTIGFSVRKEENNSAIDILGGITQLSAGRSSDTDILDEFIQSQQLVELVDKRLDLR